MGRSQSLFGAPTGFNRHQRFSFPSPHILPGCVGRFSMTYANINAKDRAPFRPLNTHRNHSRSNNRGSIRPLPTAPATYPAALCSSRLIPCLLIAIQDTLENSLWHRHQDQSLPLSHLSRKACTELPINLCGNSPRPLSFGARCPIFSMYSKILLVLSQKEYQPSPLGDLLETERIYWNRKDLFFRHRLFLHPLKQRFSFCLGFLRLSLFPLAKSLEYRIGMAQMQSVMKSKVPAGNTKTAKEAKAKLASDWLGEEGEAVNDLPPVSQAETKRAGQGVW